MSKNYFIRPDALEVEIKSLEEVVELENKKINQIMQYYG